MHPDLPEAHRHPRLSAYLWRTRGFDRNQIKTNEEIAGLSEGESRLIEPADLRSFIDTPLEFGRFLGPYLTTLILNHHRLIQGIHHENESFWRIEGNSLVFVGLDGMLTTTFDMVLQHENLIWLLGRFRDGRTVHYLTPARYRAPFSETYVREEPENPQTGKITH